MTRRHRLAVGVAAAVAVALGSVLYALQAIAPVPDVSGMAVDGVTPRALTELPSCERLIGEDDDEREARVEELAGGRLTSSQLFECPDAFDGLEVSYAGEVVGDILARAGGAWAQVNDDPYALDVGPLRAHGDGAGYNSGIAVWLPDDFSARVDGVGGPGWRGDVVTIEGVFERADRQDGGGPTIRASSLEVLAPAERVDQPLHVPQAVVAGVLSALAVVSLAVMRRRSRRR